ncbi:SET domain-containing protein isoform 4 [Hibiscus syriacus]|uniref:SET domain-containing protein isoform 4 n=1 Tax=Hibiscus syriacus TaxID=106335 RepID=A0A6A3A6T0_HIBSY|nr:SET domain-containing protein isoform 4 [Hibiscus syriacus]
MKEDQSVVGRRRIYYDQNGGEALICSDSEEEIIEEDEDKKDFVESEDFILRMTFKDVGLSDRVLESLGQCLSRSPAEVKARYETLMKEKDVGVSKNKDTEVKNWNSFIEKDLEAALDSFDNLFCRRCLVFDCRLHVCSQDLIFPADKQNTWNHPDEENAPCGLHCYRLVLRSERNDTVRSPMNPEDRSNSSSDGVGAQISSSKKSARRKAKLSQSESASSNARNISESSDSEIRPGQEESSPIPQLSPSKNKIVRKSGILKRNSKRVAECVLVCMRKRQKKMAASESDSLVSGCVSPTDMKLRSSRRKQNEDSMSSSHKDVKSLNTGSNNCLGREEFVDENLGKQEPTDDKSWKAIEKGLFEKGVEIFGKNRNLLNGLKTCWEVFQYMTGTDNKLACHAANGVLSLLEGCSKYDLNGAMLHITQSGKGLLRKDQPCRQYNPCNCQTAYGKQCSCLLNGTCREKYCGCPKSCKNQFRGCHCAKSQCRSRQCPCYAADRECDPDVFRNCWVRNMKLLLKQQQRVMVFPTLHLITQIGAHVWVLLGRSDVSGWGAFLKFALDAYRKGDKLKFANHSPEPNYYAKVIVVAGDHRVGIFAKERINAGEELFYDYRYEPDRAPV